MRYIIDIAPMKTQHHIYFSDSTNMDAIESNSIDLVVTSPPYPMIEMWDRVFSEQDSEIRKALAQKDGNQAFELMHRVLDPIWKEVFRVMKNGGFACINIGDATRTINENFALYPNHMRVLKCLLELGFTALPCILWRKQTNAPNKFMGSGTLPAGAYVTLEHEYILILRKGPKRIFQTDNDKKRRRQSSIFWEERNNWFSDVWFDIKGTLQTLNDKDTRLRSAAFPFDMVYRLVNMYSVKEDVVLDPFLGTGTTTAACIASGRNSVGFEIDANLKDAIFNISDNMETSANQYMLNRIDRHLSFVKTRLEAEKTIKHKNKHYGFPVVMSQEKEILLNEIMEISTRGKNCIDVLYSDKPHACLIPKDEQTVTANDILRCELLERSIASYAKPKGSQLGLF